MLLQTNSYIVPKEKRTEHARLLQRFKQVMARLGCEHFEVFEQVGANWTGAETGRFVQILRFRDRQHVLAVQAAEKTDDNAKQLIQEFCDLVNLPYQQQAGLFAAGYYNSVINLPLPGGAPRTPPNRRAAIPVTGMAAASAVTAAAASAAPVTESDDLGSDPAPIAEPASSDVLGAGIEGDLDIGALAEDTAFGLTGDAGKRPTEPVNGEIELLNYLEDDEPAPAGDDPRQDRLD
ncbi:MAG TPA: hypothetical protein PLD59_14720 [Tepidisphaeraceae bacterium]|nr:hypothetical protein [Tepidisphaeraceae bacterium]